MSRRWISSKEIGELFRRASFLIDHRGDDSVDDRYVSRFETPMFTVILCTEDILRIDDRVATVMVADYGDGGIREVYGSTARNVLLAMRKIMVLEDVAGVI
jgi:hypothetical protein